jgi:hypothetical protein
MPATNLISLNGCFTIMNARSKLRLEFADDLFCSDVRKGVMAWARWLRTQRSFDEPLTISVSADNPADLDDQYLILGNGNRIAVNISAFWSEEAESEKSCIEMLPGLLGLLSEEIADWDTKRANAPQTDARYAQAYSAYVMERYGFAQGIETDVSPCVNCWVQPQVSSSFSEPFLKAIEYAV